MFVKFFRGGNCFCLESVWMCFCYGGIRVGFWSFVLFFLVMFYLCVLGFYIDCVEVFIFDFVCGFVRSRFFGKGLGRYGWGCLGFFLFSYSLGCFFWVCRFRDVDLYGGGV